MFRTHALTFLILAALPTIGLASPYANPGKSRACDEFSVTVLSDIAGSEAVDINNHGHVLLAVQRQAFLWDSGTTIPLGGLPDEPMTIPVHINDRAQAAGISGGNDPTHAFLWQDGTMIDLGAPEGGVGSYIGTKADLFSNTVGTGIALNARGQVVGGWFTSVPDPRGLHEGAYLWDDGIMMDLGTLPGGSGSVASGVSDRGEVVGLASFADGTSHAFVWKEGVMTDLGTLPGRRVSAAYQINGHGDILGTACLYDEESGDISDCHAVVWQKHDGHHRRNSRAASSQKGPSSIGSKSYRMIDLGTLPGKTTSFAYAINDGGEIVGESCSFIPFSCGAFLWSDGRMTDVTPLVKGAIVSASANAINERGQVVIRVSRRVINHEGLVWDSLLWDHGKFIAIPLPAGYDRALVNDLNNLGQMVGFAFPRFSGLRALLWTPSCK